MTGLDARAVAPHELTWCGGVLVAASAALPWLTGGGSSGAALHPIMTGPLRPSALLLVLVVLSGAACANRSPVGVAIAGSAGMLWLGFSLAVWSVGLRLQDLTPASVLPDGVALRPAIGVTFGILGGFALVFAAVIECARTTWPSLERYTLGVGRCAVVLALSGAMLASRGLPWVRVDAVSNRWSLGADAIPVVAELMTVVVLVTLVVLWVWTFTRRRWADVALLATGAVTLLFGLASGMLIGALGVPISSLLRRLGVVTTASVEVDVAMGPWVLAAVGLAISVVAASALRSHQGSGLEEDDLDQQWSEVRDSPRYG